jgi:hypothetical protein
MICLRIKASYDFTHISGLAEQRIEAVWRRIQQFLKNATEATPVKVENSATSAREWLPNEEKRRRLHFLRWQL